MKHFPAVSAVLLIAVLTSCNEKLPLSTSSNISASSDTTYMAAVERAEERVVLVEESTGVKCTNCPAGAEILRQAEALHPNRVLIVAEHTGFNAKPIPGASTEVFSTDDLELLINTYFGGEPAMPAAAFDRVQQSGSDHLYFTTARSKWLEIINKRLAIPPTVNLSVISTFDKTSNQYFIKIKGVYTTTVTQKHSLTLMLIQNHIIDAQDSSSTLVANYEHNHVVRDIITDYAGTPLLDEFPTKEAGRVFIKNIAYKIPADKKQWIPENMELIAFVHNSEQGDKDVQQAASCKLK